MLLHQHQEEFKALIRSCANYYKMKEFQIEKDYYVSLFLKQLKKTSVDLQLVFKGGTSLSKCYQVIDRFSEDIDLAVASDTGKVTEGQRKKLKEVIVSSIESLNMLLLNSNSVRSRRDHNNYEVHYDSLFAEQTNSRSEVLVETIVIFRPYPCNIKPISNYITRYLFERGRTDLIEQYELQPFEMMIQAVERTFIDKLFTICDYYLEGKVERYSRHIYDVHMIWKSGILNIQTVNEIMDSVIKDRQAQGDRNLSSKSGIKPNQLLEEVIEKGVYKKDYIEITSEMIHKQISYEACIDSIREIIKSEFLPESINSYQI